MPETAVDSDDATAQRQLPFEQLYEENYRSLVVFFARRELDPELSRDLAQETMIRAWKSLDEFEGRSQVKTWLLTIAVNVWKNWVRDQKTLKRDHRESSLEAVPEDLAGGEERRLWPGPTSNPEREAIEKQTIQRYRSRLEVLSPRQQECVGLWLDGWTYQEIADELGTSLQTVRASISRGKARLKHEVTESAHGETS